MGADRQKSAAETVVANASVTSLHEALALFLNPPDEAKGTGEALPSTALS